jgi:ATP-binding protein involved in chromosome partitioning
VLDADLYGPSIRKMLPEEELPEQRGSKIFPAMAQGIKLISMAHFKQDSDAVVVRAPIANGMIAQFLNQVEWGDLDFLLIDFPPGTGDIQMTLAQKARLTGALIVTTPQQVAILDVKKCMNMFDKLNVPIIGIVENMSYYMESNGTKAYPLGEGGGKLLAEHAGQLFLGEIPLHPLIGKVLDQGRSLLEVPGPAAEELQVKFLQLAKKVAAECDQLKKENDLPIKSLQVSKDGHSISINWSDDKSTKLRLSSIQKSCPCAGCVDEETGKRREPPEMIPEDLQAVEIHNVGRYALRFHFMSGCSKGIYHFDYLRRIGGGA